MLKTFKEIGRHIIHSDGAMYNFLGNWYTTFYDASVRPESGVNAIILNGGTLANDRKISTIVFPDRVEHYDVAEIFRPLSSMIGFKTHDGKCGYLNADGQEIIAPLYTSIGRFVGKIVEVSMMVPEDNQPGTAMVERCGLLDRDGLIVVPCIYNKIYSNTKMNFVVEYAGVYGAFDKHGNLVIPMVYKRIYPYKKHYTTCIGGNGKYGILNKTGEIFPCIADNIEIYDTVTKIVIDGEDNYFHQNTPEDMAVSNQIKEFAAKKVRLNV